MKCPLCAENMVVPVNNPEYWMCQGNGKNHRQLLLKRWDADRVMGFLVNTRKGLEISGDPILDTASSIMNIILNDIDEHDRLIDSWNDVDELVDDILNQIRRDINLKIEKAEAKIMVEVDNGTE